MGPGTDTARNASTTSSRAVGHPYPGPHGRPRAANDLQGDQEHVNIRRALISIAAALAAAGVYAGIAGAATSETSSNWAGYAVTPVDPAAAYSTVSGSWTQPAAKCTARSAATYAAFWVGLGGYSSTSQALEQTGTESDCNARGVATYSAWYELVPAGPVSVNLTVKPGDVITASVAVTGQSVTVSLVDTTRGTSFSKVLTMTAPDVSSAEWIAEAPSTCGESGSCRPLPLTNFGSAAFTSSSATTAAGHTGSISDPAWNAAAITLQG